MAKLPNYPYKRAPTAEAKQADKRFTERWMKLIQGQIHLAREAAKRAQRGE